MRIPRVHTPALLGALVIAVGCLGTPRLQAAGDLKLDGSWKLVLLPFGEDEVAIVKLSRQDGRTLATVADAQGRVITRNQTKTVEQTGDALKLSLTGPAGEVAFQGTLLKGGPDAGKVLGVVRFRDELYPARLERTIETKVAPLKASPLISRYVDAVNEKDLKSKIKKLEQAIEANHGMPNSQLLFGELLAVSEAAGLDVRRVAAIARRWAEEARPYGDPWLSEVKLRTLRIIGASKKFSPLAVELANDADRELGEEAIAQKEVVLELLVRAAREAGMTDVAKDAAARLAKIAPQADLEYQRKVPPFSPSVYSGRKNGPADRVVLMELFTGAQCRPCVASDVAFDALAQTYTTSEFIGLEYHLHVPGPDPLTNNDSLARQKYYGTAITGTPSTFFNGRREAGGGGPMGASQSKYKEYRELIENALVTKSNAKLTLAATRAGDQITIVAHAEVRPDGDNPAAGSRKGSSVDGPKSARSKEQSQEMLRLALTEESVRYVGGNRLRFHHHVVRACPGGTQGMELKNGKAKLEVTLRLRDLKRDLEAYQTGYAKTRAFPKPPPEIKLERLAVVAFVQNDGDRSILNAVSVPIKQERP
jgi:hypothetical protein